MARTCFHTKNDGSPCGMAPLDARDYCWAHDPENARDRAEARKRGGLNRRTPKGGSGGGDGGEPQRYRSVEAIQELLERTVADTLLQENTDKRSRTVATLAGSLMKALEVGEWEERLAALEAAQTKRRSA